MSFRVVVVGIPGVGKTTVVEASAAKTRGGKLVTFGSVMLEEAIKLKWIEHRDQLRTLSVVRQKRLQRLAATRISRMKQPTLFVDTHLFVRTKEGFWPGLPFEVVRALKPTHLVLIEAGSKEIVARRARDTTRYRDVISHTELESEIALARSFLTVASALTGAPMLILKNEEGKVDDTVNKLVSMMKVARK
jgi:adenylate kinase